MTQHEFIEKHRHEIAGWVVDAATYQEMGAGKAVLLRGLMKKIDQKLAEVWHAFQPKNEPKPDANGAKGTTPVGVRNGPGK